jgi:hypothetical protein
VPNTDRVQARLITIIIRHGIHGKTRKDQKEKLFLKNTYRGGLIHSSFVIPAKPEYSKRLNSNHWIQGRSSVPPGMAA